VKILETQKEIGRVVPELADPNLREIILANYRIIYKIVSKSQVDILTIHHSRRSIKLNKGLESET